MVRGVLILNEGDRIPADAALISCHDFATNESMLTGESVPVRKTGQPGVGKMLPPGGEGSPFIYSGTLVVQGQGTALVLATGSRTELGKIGKSLHEMESDDIAERNQQAGAQSRHWRHPAQPDTGNDLWSHSHYWLQYCWSASPWQ